MCMRAEALHLRIFASRTYWSLGFLLTDRTPNPEGGSIPRASTRIPQEIGPFSQDPKRGRLGGRGFTNRCYQALWKGRDKMGR